MIQVMIKAELICKLMVIKKLNGGVNRNEQ